MKTCKIDGCNKIHHGKEYCKIHYSKYVLNFNQINCLVSDCNNIIGKNGAKGLCCKHYKRFKKYGDPLITTRIKNLFSTKQFITNISLEDINNYIFKDTAQWSNACKLYYGDKCSECNWNEVTCDVNHIIPKSKGGLNVIINGEVLCPNCHAKKHRRLSIEKRKCITR